ncbi:Hsp70 family protein [Paucibacter sp. KCTC 42545]|uniref:Hsp70 family protein n=1 Tax=Paucibacter sp. KCTC 42545 TaxID=1768242 RepID=UPI000733B53F|nr:Hsp70 family protein [Paucibacter sp. KCTC 42545]ALT79114.1 heat-shock protein [Paucibacter sp. KCTC 42545]
MSSSIPHSASFCAIDFGTSNSAIAIPRRHTGDGKAAMDLVELEPGHLTMPTAVFYFVEGRHDADGPPRAFGRAAVAAYVEGSDGRLMRSMKSILGSGLIDQTTDVGGGRGIKYVDILAGYLKRLRSKALAAGADAPLNKVVLGRPVFFVDGEPARDAAAQKSLEGAAHAAGFDEVHFQFEPIAAAFDFESQATEEQIVLVADIGGGTSDFSVVRVGPQRMQRLDRRDDILANHGVHIAGTDFDRHVELASILREFGYRSHGPERPGSPAREVPSGVYFDLATWHLINTVYSPGRVAELRSMRSFYGNVQHHQRLMTVVEDHLGHELAARAEGAKIAVSGGGDTVIDLGIVENGLQIELSETVAVAALDADINRIVQCGRETVAMAGLKPEQINALYFTGGSTGLRLLAERIAADYPQATLVRGDRFASVATGLGLHAARLFAR